MCTCTRVYEGLFLVVRQYLYGDQTPSLPDQKWFRVGERSTHSLEPIQCQTDPD